MLMNDCVALSVSSTIGANGNETTFVFGAINRTVGVANAGRVGEGEGDSFDGCVAHLTYNQITTQFEDSTLLTAQTLLNINTCNAHFLVPSSFLPLLN